MNAMNSFARDAPDALDRAARERWLRAATNAAIATAALLIVAKLAAWLMTGAVSVLASLIDSLMDVVASTINLYAVRYSLMPADAEHRFGHGKAEALAGLAQATFITGSAVFLVLHAVDRLLHPAPIEAAGVAITVIAFATIATLVLVVFQQMVVRRTGSTAVRADSLHYRSDLLVNVSIIVALVLSSLGWPACDALFAVAIAGYILFSSWQIARDALNLLMDRELPEAERQQILSIAQAHAGAQGVHELRTRQAGATRFVQLHLELDENLSLKQAHAIADEVEEAIRAAYADVDVIIHQDPIAPA